MSGFHSEVVLPPAWRSLLLSMLALLPVALLVFLVDCAFFAAWNGQAVTVAPPLNEEPATYVVRIVQADGSVRTASWDTVLVRQLSLPVDPIEDAPIEIPDTRPDTKKSRFSLSYEVQLGEGTDSPRWTSWPTTSTRSLAIAALVYMVLIGLRNMIIAGSPIALERPPKAKASATGTTSSSSNSSRKPGPRRSQPGPPPPGRSKGRGRR